LLLMLGAAGLFVHTKKAFKSSGNFRITMCRSWILFSPICGPICPLVSSPFSFLRRPSSPLCSFRRFCRIGGTPAGSRAQPSHIRFLTLFCHSSLRRPPTRSGLCEAAVGVRCFPGSALAALLFVLGTSFIEAYVKFANIVLGLWSGRFACGLSLLDLLLRPDISVWGGMDQRYKRESLKQKNSM